MTLFVLVTWVMTQKYRESSLTELVNGCEN